MNEFDQFIKHVLNVRYYTRYTDDFAIVADNPEYLKSLLPQIEKFLQEKLMISLHPKKVTIRRLEHGIDFLGYIVFPKYRSVRTKTKRRIFRKMKKRIAEYECGDLAKESLEQTLQSYLGVLSHANTHRLQEKMLNNFPLL